MKKFLSISALIMATVIITLFTGCKQDIQEVKSENKKQVATPVASVADGHEFPAGGGTVSFTCSTEGAVIYYTTGGGNPDVTYADPVSITETTTLIVQAKKTGMTDSDLLVVSYTCAGLPPANKVATPVPSVADGHEFPVDGGTVSFTCATEGATIRYTFGNGNPNIIHNAPISITSITEPTTVRVQARKSGMTDSDILVVSYTVAPPPESRVKKPAASVADGYGFPADGGTVSLSCETEGAAIYYTTGSGNPTILYSSPIAVGWPATTIKAVAKKTGLYDSETLVVSYTRETPQSMQYASSMKIGWNLGNALEGHSNLTPSDGAWQSGRQVTQALINAVAAQGFDTVRIPVTWGQKLHTQLRYSVSSSNFTLTVPQIEALTLDAAWLNKVAEVVGWVNAAGMKAIINIHHDGADSSYWLSVKNEHLSGASKEKIDAIFRTLWSQIADKFRNTGDSLLFEAFNELHDGNWGSGSTAQRNRINELNQIFVDTVRAAGGENTNRYLVVAGYVTNPSASVSSLVMPTDPAPQRLFVSVHFYDPYNFTLSAEQSVWGEKATSSFGNESNVQSTFDNVKNRFINNGIPVIIGEYGATRQSSAAGKAYRKYYMEYVTKYAHDCGFIPIYWDNGGSGSGAENSGLFNRASPHGLLTDASDIIAVMMKAAKENYLLSGLTPP
jgi:aryl-phospho-beta-D-glucosidase BglC (GH1 family)